jgi:hypothetical protein
MNPMIFPKMLSSHEEGWSWLMSIHPSVTRLYLFYAVPLSIIPPAMLFYGWSEYHQLMFSGISANEAMLVCGIFFLVELVMVPLMAVVISRISSIAEVMLPFQDAFALATIAPTPLWLTPLFLFVPSMIFNAVMLALALFATGMLIYQGVPKVCHVEDEGKSILLAGAIIAAGLVGWVAMMILGFVSLGLVVA